jgi:hypothetical protein
MDAGAQQARPRRSDGNGKDCHVGIGLNKSVRTVHGPSHDGFLGERGAAVGAHESASFVFGITVSPYWYIRGMTPRCRIRRGDAHRIASTIPFAVPCGSVDGFHIKIKFPLSRASTRAEARRQLTRQCGGDSLGVDGGNFEESAGGAFRAPSPLLPVL